jgi:hypothetical protein
VNNVITVIFIDVWVKDGIHNIRSTYGTVILSRFIFPNEFIPSYCWFISQNHDLSYQFLTPLFCEGSTLLFELYCRYCFSYNLNFFLLTFHTLLLLFLSFHSAIFLSHLFSKKICYMYGCTFVYIKMGNRDRR